MAVSPNLANQFTDDQKKFMVLIEETLDRNLLTCGLPPEGEIIIGVHKKGAAMREGQPVEYTGETARLDWRMAQFVADRYRKVGWKVDVQDGDYQMTFTFNIKEK